MKNSVEKLAKTVDEAVEEALKELNISMDEAIIEVLDEGEAGGLLGFGRRPARVRVSYEPAYQEDSYEEEYEDDGYIEEDFSADNYDTDYDEPYEEDDLVYEDEEIDFDENYDDDYREEFSTDIEHDHSKDYSPEEKEIIEGKAVEFVARILQSLGIHGRISSFYTDEGSLRIDVSGEDLGNAIGRRGETLDAIQYLTTLAVNQDHERYQRISLDIDYYRDRQMKQIRHKARRAAEKVLKSGRRFVMYSMPAAERRQVHLALVDFQGISTYSEGEEPNRSVVIVPEGKERKNHRRNTRRGR